MRSLGEDESAGPLRSIRVLLSPQVQQSTGVSDVAKPTASSTFAGNQAFLFQSHQHAMRQPSRDFRLTSKTPDLPASFRMQQQGLDYDPALPLSRTGLA